MIQVAQLDGYSPRKDRTVSIRFVTQELTPAQVMEIHEMLDTFGILYFRAGEKMPQQEIKELDKIDLDLYDQPKSQSQRLRAVLYKLWKQDEVGKFKDFYKIQTDKIIEHYKTKLDADT